MAREVSDFLTDYCSRIAPHTEAPERFHFWTAASMIAGALRRRVYLDEGTFRWYSNMLVILVGPPGVVKKSTTIHVGTKMLRSVEGVKFGADCTTWQAFIQEIANAEDWHAEGDTKLEVDAEGNVTNMGERYHTNTRALTCAISELGTFLDTRDRQMVSCLTDLWDSKTDIPWIKGTKTQGKDEIINPFVNIIAGTTPQWLADNFKDQIGGWGLSSRCIFLYADAPERYIAFPSDEWGGSFDEIIAPLQTTLQHIATLCGPYTYTLEAKLYGRQLYEAHGDRMTLLHRSKAVDPWLAYFLARKWDHINKLAMLIAASRKDDLVIEIEDLQSAALRVDQAEDELHLVFTGRHVTRDPRAERADGVWEHVWNIATEHDGIEEEGMYALLLQYMTYRQCDETIAGYLAGGWMQRVQNERGQMGFILTEKAPSPRGADPSLASRIAAAQEATQARHQSPTATPGPGPTPEPGELRSTVDLSQWQTDEDPVEDWDGHKVTEN